MLQLCSSFLQQLHVQSVLTRQEELGRIMLADLLEEDNKLVYKQQSAAPTHKFSSSLTSITFTSSSCSSQQAQSPDY